MLMTLSASCLRPLLVARGSARPTLALADLPSFTRQTLGLHGLNLSTDLLAGMHRSDLERLRERADKAGCACLVLIEPEPQAFGETSEACAEAAADRTRRVIEAGYVLGCSAVSVSCLGADDEGHFERTAERLKRIVQRAERLEINLLLSPREGLTQTPERITELIKKVGGFRVGTHPDFQAAAATADPSGYLRRLTPYASIVTAATVDFTPVEPEPEASKPRKRTSKTAKKAAPPPPPPEDEDAEELDEAVSGPVEPPEPPMRHEAYDLEPLVKAVMSVGYDGTLALDYRGGGDPTLGVARSRRAIERLLGLEQGEA